VYLLVVRQTPKGKPEMNETTKAIAKSLIKGKGTDGAKQYCLEVIRVQNIYGDDNAIKVWEANLEAVKVLAKA
jgi:hypothetical protein